MKLELNGAAMHHFAKRLWPIYRSITGDGVRETLSIIKEILPELQIKEVSSGTEVFDWTVPQEWKVRDAWIISPSGRKICNFQDNNLHVVGYSSPIRAHLTLSELSGHLYSLPDQPSAIPYVTSYYKEHWGFCISHGERERLEDGIYEVCVDSEFANGSLTYGELLIEGDSPKEIFLSTYICHPSMANNELSGPVVTAFIAKWLLELEEMKYSCRIIFIPETIGSIVYLSLNKDKMKADVIAGFNVTCIGDDRDYSYLPSRQGNTLSDIVAQHILKHIHPSFKSYRWSDRGSDERQYCAPNIDLPIASIMRTKYGEYPEYHTSLDDLVNVVTPDGLAGGYNVLRLAIEAIQRSCYPSVTVYGEPQLGKRGLYPSLSTKTSAAEVRLMMNLITWSDGSKSLVEIADLCEVPVWGLYPILDTLVALKLLRVC